MNNVVVIVGMGEMGGVFSRALLKAGHPVIPILRHHDLAQLANDIPKPQMVLVAVAENDFHKVLGNIPSSWQSCVALLQNELLPRDWEAYQIDLPTVISVWFEKKKGKEFKVLVPSPVYGPHAQTLASALSTLDIPTEILTNSNDLLFQLVRKNLYILTTNIAGLEVGGNVNQLWNRHQALAKNVASDVMDIQQWLTGQSFDRDKLTRAMQVAIEGDPEHMCMGRSAPNRLKNAIKLADQGELSVPTLREIAAKHL